MRDKKEKTSGQHRVSLMWADRLKMSIFTPKNFAVGRHKIT